MFFQAALLCSLPTGKHHVHVIKGLGEGEVIGVPSLLALPLQAKRFFKACTAFFHGGVFFLSFGWSHLKIKLVTLRYIYGGGTVMFKFRSILYNYGIVAYLHKHESLASGSFISPHPPSPTTVCQICFPPHSHRACFLCRRPALPQNALKPQKSGLRTFFLKFQ